MDERYLAKREQINNLLYVAEGYYDAGLFDQASLEYEKILILDPYNKAARIGMTKVEEEKSGYYETAYQESRSTYLNQIAAQWEKPVSVSSLRATQLQGTYVVNDNGSEMTSKALDNIIIPSIDLEDMNLYEVIEQLRQLSKEYDTRTVGTERGLNFIVRDNGDITNPIAERRIDKLYLTEVPLKYILESVCSKLDLGFKAEEFAVVLFPKGDGNGVLRQRTFLVPPDFKTALSDSAGTSSTLTTNDPFAAPAASSGGTSANASIQELLQGRGIKFAEPASASLVGNKLIVSNTQENIDLLESIIDEIKLKTNTAVRIVSKFMEINQNDLDELSFDWSLGDTSGIANGIVGGTTGSGLARTADDFASGSVGDIVTSGLRSGSGAISSTALSSIIGNSDRLSGAATDTVAPGVLSFLDNDFLNGSQLELVMRGLSQKKGVDILIAPSVMAKNGQEALIEVVDEMRYPTSYEAPQIPDSITAASISPVAPANPTDFEIEKLGVSLRVTPNLGANNQTISLDFKPTIVEFDGFINYGSPINGYDTTAVNADGSTGASIEITSNSIEQPVFSRRKIETQLTLYDGNTVAVGGLIKEERITVEDKVPILGDLPFIGRLFQSKVDSQDRSNLVIFVTARVVDASGEAVNKLNPGAEEGILPESLIAQ